LAKGRIRERLDRGVSNVQWNDLFPTTRQENGGMFKSNHRPLIVETKCELILMSLYDKDQNASKHGG
jgi:hypothetical protein